MTQLCHCFLFFTLSPLFVLCPEIRCLKYFSILQEYIHFTMNILLMWKHAIIDMTDVKILCQNMQVMIMDLFFSTYMTWSFHCDCMQWSLLKWSVMQRWNYYPVFQKLCLSPLSGVYVASTCVYNYRVYTEIVKSMLCWV
jgi:hypothetical protein